MTTPAWKTGRCIVALLLVVACRTLSSAEDAAPPSNAAVLAVGDAAPLIFLHDQRGAEVRVDATTHLLLFTRDMTGGGLVKEALAEGGSEALAKAKAVYVSDVSGMPGLVRSAFALPAMRKRPYAIALDEEGKATAALPWRDGKASVVVLESGRITAISFASTPAEVKVALAE